MTDPGACICSRHSLVQPEEDAAHPAPLLGLRLPTSRRQARQGIATGASHGPLAIIVYKESLAAGEM